MSKRKLNSGDQNKLKKRRCQLESISDDENDEDDELNIALQASRRIIPEPLPQNILDQPGTSGAFHFAFVNAPEDQHALNSNVNFEGQ
jgi:hypothetical protein|tara:strand:+ start:283 stop:546 length:264 start_codon:yes stop_codon:yes gene_type:complete